MLSTMRRLLPYLVGVLILMGGTFSFYSSIENHFMYYPSSSLDYAPEDLRLTHKEVFFEAKDGVCLHGWLFPLRNNSPVLLICHGNAGNISHRLELIKMLVERGLQVCIFDYRGYGRSEGKPSEDGIYRDGIAAYEYLVSSEGFSPEDIILFGRSLGAAVAIEVACTRPVRAVILEGAFTSSKEMARTLPLFAIISPLLPAHYNNLEKIGSVNVPKLFIHAERDEIVPIHMGKRLFNVSSPPKSFVTIGNAGHNDTHVIGGNEYIDAISDFAVK